MNREIRLGQTAQISKKITDTDLTLFAAVTGDFNPIHFDPIYAAATPFKERIAHGMILAGLISAVIGMKQPGQGTIYLEQTLHFLAPVKVGDVVTASVEVIDLLEKHRVRLKTKCVRQDGVLVLDGEALVIAPTE